jgi:hypothetical protein
VGKGKKERKKEQKKKKIYAIQKVLWTCVREEERRNHSDESSVALRDEVEGKDKPVEVRRWRFMARVPMIPVRAVGDNLVAVKMLPVVDARGLVDDDAIFGRLVVPFRAVPLGAPEARFLQERRQQSQTQRSRSMRKTSSWWHQFSRKAVELPHAASAKKKKFNEHGVSSEIR